jgi:hypothetical protein
MPKYSHQTTRTEKQRLHTIMQANCDYINRSNVDRAVDGLNDMEEGDK